MNQMILALAAALVLLFGSASATNHHPVPIVTPADANPVGPV
jgi:hypothetical protein